MILYRKMIALTFQTMSLYWLTWLSIVFITTPFTAVGGSNFTSTENTNLTVTSLASPSVNESYSSSLTTAPLESVTNTTMATTSTDNSKQTSQQMPTTTTTTMANSTATTASTPSENAVNQTVTMATELSTTTTGKTAVTTTSSTIPITREAAGISTTQGNVAVVTVNNLTATTNSTDTSLLSTTVSYSITTATTKTTVLSPKSSTVTLPTETSTLNTTTTITTTTLPPTSSSGATTTAIPITVPVTPTDITTPTTNITTGTPTSTSSSPTTSSSSSSSSTVMTTLSLTTISDTNITRPSTTVTSPITTITTTAPTTMTATTAPPITTTATLPTTMTLTTTTLPTTMTSSSTTTTSSSTSSTTTVSSTTSTPGSTTSTPGSTASTQGSSTQSSSTPILTTSLPVSSTESNATIVKAQTGLSPEMTAVVISVPVVVVLIGVVTAGVLYIICCRRRRYRDPIHKPGRHFGRELSKEVISSPLDAEEGTSEVVNQYEVVYPYKSQAEDQISLCSGDLIDVLERDDSGWWLGKLGNKKGWFPGNYVEVVKGNRGKRRRLLWIFILFNYCFIFYSITTGISNYGYTENTAETFGKKKTKQETEQPHNEYVNDNTIFLEREKYYKVLHPYHAAEFGELELSEGDVIVVKAVDHQQDWMWGTLDVSGEEGWFPSSYVQEVGGDDQSVEAEVMEPLYSKAYEHLKRNQQRDHGAEDIIGIEHQALYAYHSELPGDLSFNTGDLIVVTEIMENGWWFGLHGKKQGWFPGSYLEIIDQDQDVPKSTDYQYVQLSVGRGDIDQTTDQINDQRVSAASYIEFISSDFPPPPTLASDTTTSSGVAGSVTLAPIVELSKSSTLKRKPKRPAPPAPKAAKKSSPKSPDANVELKTFSPSNAVVKKKPNVPKIDFPKKPDQSIEMADLPSPESATSKKSFEISGPQLISSTADLEAHRIKTIIRKRQEKPAVPTRWVIPRLVKIPTKRVRKDATEVSRPVHRAPPPRPQPPDPEKIKQTVTGQTLHLPQTTDIGGFDNKHEPKTQQVETKQDSTEHPPVLLGIDSGSKPGVGIGSKPDLPKKPIAAIKPVRKNNDGESHMSELESILARRKRPEASSVPQDAAAASPVVASVEGNSSKPAVPKLKPSLPVKPNLKLRSTSDKVDGRDSEDGEQASNGAPLNQTPERTVPQPKPRSKIGQGQGQESGTPFKPKPRTTVGQGHVTIPKLSKRSQSESDTLSGYSTTPDRGDKKAGQRPPRPGQRPRTRSVDGAIDVPSKVESAVFPPLQVGASAIRQRPNRPPPPRLTKIWNKEESED
ncbi:uncharacterized protein LOC106176107 [Lingula anatina]|uniref:Uncharacterized protein LOC106176107 n=1 Tax=Lingula anatina TaxID=7574 RepID=A0A2R2MS15_LINAN|nr:uncharacterized protein LOC106176107 [Lingula anatina]|eukprot:XP_023932918.1 uncharacterized protein LOC106176107 [Lingula anatina]